MFICVYERWTHYFQDSLFPSLSLSLIDIEKAPISNFNTLVGSKVFTKHKTGRKDWYICRILIINGNQNGIFNTAARKTTNEQASQQNKK